ncbi:MAG: autotransporter domain-containing protein [Oceanospirillaceae bacterium]|nr:autotransporter domain-containing protein [Oceanospirillaceae bacterium]
MRKLLIGSLLLAGGQALLTPQSYADDSLSFTFSPPPITRPGEQVNKFGFNFTSLEFESTDTNGYATTTEFSLVGLNMLTKNHGGFFGMSLVTGSDDQDITSVTALNFNGGGEMKNDNGFAMSMGIGFNMIFVTVDMSDADNYFYSETSMGTLQFDLALQQRIALGDNFGITPYVSMSYMMLGSGTSTTTVIVMGNSYESTTDVELDPYISTQVGLDMDIGGMSLAAMVQESDSTSMTSINIGFEF